MFRGLRKVNYWLLEFLFVHGGMGGIYLSCLHSPRFQSLCLHLSQHDMVWKLPVCLLMMINVHSRVSNLGSLEESRRWLPRATCGGSWLAELFASPAWVRCLLNFSIFPLARCGTFLGLWLNALGWSRWAGPKLASLTCLLDHIWLESHRGVSRRVTPSCPSLPAPKSGSPTRS